MDISQTILKNQDKKVLYILKCKVIFTRKIQQTMFSLNTEGSILTSPFAPLNLYHAFKFSIVSETECKSNILVKTLKTVKKHIRQ